MSDWFDEDTLREEYVCHQEEIARLRESLRALVDATKHAPHAERWADPSTFYSARDAAVRLLGGDE